MNQFFELLQALRPSKTTLISISFVLLVLPKSLIECLIAGVLIIKDALLVELLVHFAQSPSVDQVEILPREVDIVQFLFQRVDRLFASGKYLPLPECIEAVLGDCVLGDAKYIFEGGFG